MYDPNEYTVTSRRTTVEDETVFEARVIELPDVVGYGDTRDEAEAAAIESISGLQDLAKEMGHPFPAPNPVPAEYAGRLTLRVSRSLHRQIALLAYLEDVSLNQFINEAITARVAARQARTTGEYHNVAVGNYFNVAAGGVFGAMQVIAAARPVGESAMLLVSDHYNLKGSELFATTGYSEGHVPVLVGQDVKWTNRYLPGGDS
jgi:predicted HicB family RNase H-like nuclease